MAARRCWPEGEVRRGLGEAKSQGLTRAKIRRARDTTKPRPTSLDRLRYGHGTPRTHSAHTPPARPPPQADHAHVALGGQSACLSPGSQDLNPEGPNAASGPNRYEYLRACLNRDGLRTISPRIWHRGRDGRGKDLGRNCGTMDQAPWRFARFWVSWYICGVAADDCGVNLTFSCPVRARVNLPRFFLKARQPRWVA